MKLRSTNAIENLNSGIATYARNVKRWQGGTMVVRWVSAAIVGTQKKFRRVQGWQDIQKLIGALTLLEPNQEATAERVAQDHSQEPLRREDQQRAGQPRAGLVVAVRTTHSATQVPVGKRFR